MRRHPHDDVALDALLKEGLAEGGALFTDAELDEILRELTDRIEPEMSPIDQQFLRRLDNGVRLTTFGSLPIDGDPRPAEGTSAATVTL